MAKWSRKSLKLEFFQKISQILPTFPSHQIDIFFFVRLLSIDFQYSSATLDRQSIRALEMDRSISREHQKTAQYQFSILFFVLRLNLVFKSYF